MLSIVVQSVPNGGEWSWDEVEDGNVAMKERDVIVFNSWVPKRFQENARRSTEERFHSWRLFQCRFNFSKAIVEHASVAESAYESRAGTSD